MKLQTPTMDIFLKTIKEGKCNSNIDNLDTMQCENFQYYFEKYIDFEQGVKIFLPSFLVLKLIHLEFV